jgi:two-component system, NtrC family, C4-dicarboxylate transport sensor histidine kinase DctB
MDGTRGKTRSFPRGNALIMIAAGALLVLLAWAVAAFGGLQPEGPQPAGAIFGYSHYQGMLWALVVAVLLQSVLLAFLAIKMRQRRSAESQLRGSEERFRMLAENSLAGIYLIDQDGIVQYANRTLCAMFGFERDELNGKLGFRTFIHRDDVARVAENLSKRLSGQEVPSRYEVRGVHRNGELIDIEIIGSLTSNAGKNMVVGTLLDISQRKRAERLMQEEQLQRKVLTRTLELRISEEVERSREKDRLMLQQSRFAAIGEMIGNIAHQWRQPLNMLGIVIQQMQMEQEKGLMTDRLMEERVGKGMDLLLNLSRTIDDFRSFFRPAMAPAPFKVAAAVAKTVRFFEASCSEHGIKVSVEGKSALVYIGHVNEFSQALLNILNNARDALLDTGAADPRIVVALRDDAQRSVVTVRDNAGGIDPDIIEKVFDPYFTTKEEGKGTGIGLYMAKTIIDRNMKGRISVRNLEDGAEFQIVI